MGSTKSIRYEVLVYPTPSSSPAFKEHQHQPSTSPLLPNDVTSSNHSASALFETKVQRFACDRENMQQYWIPEGFHPVLIPRAYLTNNSLVNNNNNSRQQTGDFIHHLRSRINNNDNINDIELRRRRRNANDIFSSCNNNGGITKKKRRSDVNRRILSQSSPTVNINHPLIYRQKVKERITAIRNSAVKISSNSSLKNNNSNNIITDKSSPSIIIGQMWKDEPENIKKHYERLAIRKKIAQALAFEKKFSSLNSGTRSTTINSRRFHVNPTTCSNHNTGTSCRYNVHSNAIKGVDAVDCDNVVHHNVDSSSSPNNFNDSNRPMPDWMTRSDDEDDENSSDIDLVAY
ncbi:hypothetical protein C1646_718720 [Rhizophagus diaphanus]|nr:hypothetical protein C1646_718720 [Rhizophagus diaphanus] [Rhizophagus sp. MUCL 43196]